MKKVLKTIVYFLSIFAFGAVFTNANNFSVDFSLFVDDIVLVANSNKKISFIKFLSEFNKRV